jgi:hypothetical protein
MEVPRASLRSDSETRAIVGPVVAGESVATGELAVMRLGF